jgi:hypothetical protein
VANPLYTLHRILISFAIALGALLLLYGLLRYQKTGETWALGMGLAGAAAGTTLGLYLRWFLGKRRGGS